MGERSSGHQINHRGDFPQKLESLDLGLRSSKACSCLIVSKVSVPRGSYW